MAVRSADVNVMAAAARKATRGLVRDFGELDNLQSSPRGVAGFAREAVRHVEQALLRELKHARPRFSVALSGTRRQWEYRSPDCWAIDPVSGTTNFAHAMPHFAISLAHVSGSEVTAAVVYDPLRDELFWADRGTGAYLNDYRLRVSARRTMNDSLVADGGVGGVEKTESAPPTPDRTWLGQRLGDLRVTGCIALDLAYVAAGRLDAAWWDRCEPADVAAGVLLVREAGGYATDLNGAADLLASANILVANNHLHAELGGLIRQASGLASAA